MAPVIGAKGEQLGTVASTDAQGNVQLTTSDGKTVSIALGLIANTNGQLTASSISEKDLMAMAATQNGDQAAAQQASTRTAHSRHHRVAGDRAHRVPASASGDEAVSTTDQTPSDQPMPPAETQTPAQAPAQTPQ